MTVDHSVTSHTGRIWYAVTLTKYLRWVTAVGNTSVWVLEYLDNKQIWQPTGTRYYGTWPPTDTERVQELTG